MTNQWNRTGKPGQQHFICMLQIVLKKKLRPFLTWFKAAEFFPKLAIDLTMPKICQHVHRLL
jgi:hypothetical protein